MATGVKEQGERVIAAHVSLTDQTTRVHDWSFVIGPDHPPALPTTPTDVVPLVIDPGHLLACDSSGLVVDAWLTLLFVSATADALWVLAERTRTRLDATVSHSLLQSEALDAIAEARHLRFYEGSAVPPPSPLAAQWHRWTGIYQVFALSLEGMRQLFAGQRTVGPPVVEVPPAVASKIDTVSQLVTVLQHRLKPERVSQVARRPADAYGGLSMLQMIETDRHEELARAVAASFDWGSTA
jgi:hypothetical protein